jgi:hypothetical protein
MTEFTQFVGIIRDVFLIVSCIVFIMTIDIILKGRQ